MALRDAIALKNHRVTVRCQIDRRNVYGVTGVIDYGYDAGVSSCELTLKTRPDWLRVRQEVQVWLGWDGYAVSAFRGYLEDDGRKVWPYSKTIRACGYLRMAERRTTTEVIYTNQGARAIITDLLSKAGITDVDIQGDNTTLATLDDIILAVGDTYIGLIRQIVEPWCGQVFDQPPSGVVACRTITGTPTAGAAWDYVYPGNVLSIDRPLSVRTVRNRVEVTGLDECSASRRADSPYVQAGYDEVEQVQSDLIEDDATCSAVALLWMPKVNRLTESITITVAGNPLLHPADTVSLHADKVGVTDVTNIWVKHVNHTWGADSFKTQLLLEGGLGEAGYELPKPPEPMFTITVRCERYNPGGGLATMYIVTCDASATTDPDSDSSTLTYAWANDVTADTGTDVLYVFACTQAQLDTPINVTLTVSDGTNTESLTLPVPDSIDPMIEYEHLYSAEGGATLAAATPDSGITWNTAAIAAVCTSEIGGEDHNYFGLADGKLYYTGDWLATAPTLVHTFDAGVNCVWINEVDANIVIVGCADGGVWITHDASNLASATWTEIETYASPVNWVVSGYDGGHWVLVGNQVVANGSVLATLSVGMTAKRVALSFFAHYFAGDDGAGTAEVKRLDGVTITWPGANPGTVLGLTHDIADDVLYAAGGDGKFYTKAAGATAFTETSAATGAGSANHLIRDGTNGSILYLAGANGVYKTFDKGVNWYAMRTGQASLMVGYGSAPWATLPSTTIASAVGEGKVFRLGSEPANWRDVTFDDSAWAAPVAEGGSVYGPPIAGSAWICETSGNRPVGEEWLYRRTFTLTAGIVSSATLTIWADNQIIGAWVNNTCITSLLEVVTATSFTVDPSVLLPGATNVIAIRVKNTGVAPTPTSLDYTLVVNA